MIGIGISMSPMVRADAGPALLQAATARPAPTIPLASCARLAMRALEALPIMHRARQKQDSTAAPGRAVTLLVAPAPWDFTVWAAPPTRLLAQLLQATIALWGALHPRESRALLGGGALGSRPTKLHAPVSPVSSACPARPALLESPVLLDMAARAARRTRKPAWRVREARARREAPRAMDIPAGSGSTVPAPQRRRRRANVPLDTSAPTNPRLPMGDSAIRGILSCLWALREAAITSLGAIVVLYAGGCVASLEDDEPL